MFLIAALRVLLVVFVDRYLSAPEYTTVISTARSENYILAQCSIEYVLALACVRLRPCVRTFFRVCLRQLVTAFQGSWVLEYLPSFRVHSFVYPLCTYILSPHFPSFVPLIVPQIVLSFVASLFIRTWVSIRSFLPSFIQFWVSSDTRLNSNCLTQQFNLLIEFFLRNVQLHIMVSKFFQPTKGFGLKIDC